MRSNAQDALELAELGWWLLPLHTWNVDKCDCMKQCTSPAKHPRTMHGLKDASCDLAQVVEWWGQWPAANIGVRTGPESCIVVVDIDPRNGGMESWESLREHHAYEHDGPACLTGGGGMHLYFAHPGEKVMSRSGELAEGVDVKGDGGYVVAPPSVHARGTSYAWIEGYAPWERPPGQIPFWLLELMHKPVEGISGAQPIADKITQGKRRSVLLSLAGSMRHRNMGETAIFNALMAENAEKCEPPLDMREIAKLAADAATWEPGSATILPSTKPGPSGPERREEAYVPTPRTLAELQTRTLPPTVWAVPGFLPQGIAMLAGAPKLGKSFLALGLCVAIARGEDAFEYLPTVEGDDLYLALEDGENRLQERMQGFLQDERWPERAWYEIKWPRINEGGKEALEAWLGQHPEARLIVIDTFALFKQSGEGLSNKDIYAGDYAAIRAVKSIADAYGVCILLITHQNKGEHRDWINSQTGSTGLTGAADTLLGLERPDGIRDVSVKNEATLRLTGRDVEEQAWACERDKASGAWRIIGDAVEAGEERSSNQTVNYMQMLWQDGYQEVTATLLRTVSNTTKATANRNLSNTANKGLIIRLSQGTYGLLDKDKPRSFGGDSERNRNAKETPRSEYQPVIFGTESERSERK